LWSLDGYRIIIWIFYLNVILASFNSLSFFVLCLSISSIRYLQMISAMEIFIFKIVQYLKYILFAWPYRDFLFIARLLTPPNVRYQAPLADLLRSISSGLVCGNNSFSAKARFFDSIANWSASQIYQIKFCWKFVAHFKKLTEIDTILYKKYGKKDKWNLDFFLCLFELWKRNLQKKGSI